MNSKQHHFLRVLSGILVGVMAFCIALFLTFFAEVIMLSNLQFDFMLPIQWVILLVIACIGGVVFAIFAGRRYFRDWGKSQ